MADNYNINLDSAAQGAKDVNSLGSTIAQNAATQLNQEQLVAQAIEKTKQEQIGTQEKQVEFDSEAYLSKLGLMQKSQALGQLKIVMQKQGLPEEEQASIMQTAQDTFPAVMDGTAIWRFWTALREPKPTAATRGQTFQATKADVANAKKDSSGAPVVEGQGYITDTDGNWIRSGQSQDQIDAQMQAKSDRAGDARGAKDIKSDSQGLLKLNAAIDGLLKTRFGSTGMLATTIFRAVRAINTLQQNPNLTAQDLENVATDIAAIYQGGVPGQVQTAANQYKSVFLDFANTFRRYTGHTLNPSSWFHNANTPRSPVVTDTENKMLQTLNDMRTSSEQSLQMALESESAAFKLAKVGDPSAIDQLIESKMKFIESGVLVPDSAHTVLRIGDKVTASGSVSIPGSPGAAVAEQAGAVKLPSGASYTVNP
jgi:hypothetical protein